MMRQYPDRSISLNFDTDHPGGVGSTNTPQPPLSQPGEFCPVNQTTRNETCTQCLRPLNTGMVIVTDAQSTDYFCSRACVVQNFTH